MWYGAFKGRSKRAWGLKTYFGNTLIGVRKVKCTWKRIIVCAGVLGARGRIFNPVAFHYRNMDSEPTSISS